MNEIQNKKYDKITAHSFESLKTPQERSVWLIKLLGHRFLSCYLNSTDDPDEILPQPDKYDPATVFDGHTFFSQAVETGYFQLATNYIRLNKNHPDFKKGLNLTSEKTIKALEKLFSPDNLSSKKFLSQAQKKQIQDKQKLQGLLLDVLPPLAIARCMGMKNETTFSATLKLGEKWNNLRPTYHVLQNLENKPQHVILTELNLKDKETLTLLRKITSSKSDNKHHRILTAKLQQLLTPENFIEQVRGKRLSYQDDIERKNHLREYEQTQLDTVTPSTFPQNSQDLHPNLTSKIIQLKGNEK